MLLMSLNAECDGISISVDNGSEKLNVNSLLRDIENIAKKYGNEIAIKDLEEKMPDKNHKHLNQKLATLYHKNQQLRKAISIYSDILKKDPSNKSVINNYIIAIAKESPKESMNIISGLGYKNPSFAPIFRQLGIMYSKVGDFQNAVANYSRVLSINSNNIKDNYNLAILVTAT